MVQATIDNTAVSHTLSTDDSVTVPNGETWKVTIVHSGVSGTLQINGKRVISGVSNPGYVELVLDDGDTVSHGDGDAFHLSGFKV